jgi:hypothetical protein
MNVDWFDILVQIATILIAFFGGGAALVPIVNQLKGALKLEGNAVLVLVVVISVIMGIAALLVEGQITPDSFTVSNLAALVVLIFTASQKFYDQLKGA